MSLVEPAQQLFPAAAVNVGERDDLVGLQRAVTEHVSGSKRPVQGAKERTQVRAPVALHLVVLTEGVEGVVVRRVQPDTVEGSSADQAWEAVAAIALATANIAGGVRVST